jgi:hypothetical protein
VNTKEFKKESKSLKAEDLNALEHDLTISSIKSVTFDEGQDNEETKPELVFLETPKTLILNVTNMNRIAAQYGEEMDEWVGKVISIYPTTTEFNKKEVACIRVREQADKAAPGAILGAEPGSAADPVVAGDVDPPAGDGLPF